MDVSRKFEDKGLIRCGRMGYSRQDLVDYY